MGSVLLSALMLPSGRRDAAPFVGQRPPAFLASALLVKLLRPSPEPVTGRLQESVADISSPMH